ncbi:MAG: pyridoxal 5'-phosphate synthase glutaminase subunit PdxT [Acidimicrobiales bacterium]|nr:pyridoxal 5'-phosphate synthase glutaminase subunit PdxT [Acidimicrobiales bacterium]
MREKHRFFGNIVVGVLALQGDVIEHRRALDLVGVKSKEVKVPSDLESIDGLIIPGGESTTLSLLVELGGMFDVIGEKIAGRMPIFGTCAGLIMLSKEIIDGRRDQKSFEVFEVSVKRNGYGRQLDSFEAPIALDGTSPPNYPGVFIRAPAVVSLGDKVEVLGKVIKDESPVLIRQGRILGATFHPELTDDLRVHELFISMIEEV